MVPQRRLQKAFVRLNEKNGFKNIHHTSHCYITPDGIYEVELINSSNIFKVVVSFEYKNNGYNETLYQNIFYSYNNVKAQFDSLCQKYYNEIPQ